MPKLKKAKKKKTKIKTKPKKVVSLDLPKHPFVFEVLDLVSRQRSKAKKIEVLITGVLKDFPIPDTTFYFNKGDKIKVQIVEIDIEKQKIRASKKMLKTDPFSFFDEKKANDIIKKEIV